MKLSAGRPLPIAGVVETCQDFVNITKRDGSETQARLTGAGRAAGLRAPPLQLSATQCLPSAVQLIAPICCAVDYPDLLCS